MVLTLLVLSFISLFGNFPTNLLVGFPAWPSTHLQLSQSIIYKLNYCIQSPYHLQLGVSRPRTVIANSRLVCIIIYSSSRFRLRLIFAIKCFERLLAYSFKRKLLCQILTQYKTVPSHSPVAHNFSVLWTVNLAGTLRKLNLLTQLLFVILA